MVSALPVLGRELSVGAGAATWLLTAFMLAAGVVTPIAGRLGDLYGHRRVLVICPAALTAGSVLASLAGGCDYFSALSTGEGAAT